MIRRAAVAVVFFAAGVLVGTALDAPTAATSDRPVVIAPAQQAGLGGP